MDGRFLGGYSKLKKSSFHSYACERSVRGCLGWVEIVISYEIIFNFQPGFEDLTQFLKPLDFLSAGTEGVFPGVEKSLKPYLSLWIRLRVPWVSKQFQDRG